MPSSAARGVAMIDCQGQSLSPATRWATTASGLLLNGCKETIDRQIDSLSD